MLRRLDAVLEPTKQAVLDEAAKLKGSSASDHVLPAEAKADFFNTSKYTFASIANDPANVKANLVDYVNGFSANVRDIFDKYKIAERSPLDEHDLLFLVTSGSPPSICTSTVSNEEMGHIFEELIRKFAEASNETAGEHFTPRDVIG